MDHSHHHFAAFFKLRMSEEPKPVTVHAFNTRKGYTIIHEFADGTVKGKIHSGPRTAEFMMNKYPLWKAIAFDGDIDFVRKEISKEDFIDIDWQDKGHPVYQGRTYLINAVLVGRLDIVTLLLEHHANPNLYDDVGYTAAHYAIESDQNDIFEVLIKNPHINVNQIIDGTDPLLHMLVNTGRKEMAQMVVDRGADINLHTEDVPSPLCFSLAKGGEPECARWLLDLGANITFAFDGITPMSFAASSGLIDIMELLLEKGAILTLDKYTTTPLHAAATNNQLEAVKFLLDKGADVNEVDSDGEYAISHGADHLEMVELLLEKGAKVDVSKPTNYLFKSARSGNLKLLTLFLDTYKIDVHAKNTTGQTALFAAAEVDAKDSSNKAAHVELLIDRGIDVNATEISGEQVSALLIAVEAGKVDNVKALLKAGANPNAQDKNGLTPLHMACGNNMKEITKLLIEAGGDMNLKSHSGETPADFGKPQIGGVYALN
eukprot:Phypoly_transcript_05896.p1 GENE.Phypoly_transcript_05896~~Phypoly_transcript_05896.p1  ORF type:complete len:489 (-),score=75.61 Phypoly_transcript_05896:74-1540(-)